MSFSDRIQLVGSLAERQNDSHNELSAPILETPVTSPAMIFEENQGSNVRSKTMKDTP